LLQGTAVTNTNIYGSKRPNNCPSAVVSRHVWTLTCLDTTNTSAVTQLTTATTMKNETDSGHVLEHTDLSLASVSVSNSNLDAAAPTIRTIFVKSMANVLLRVVNSSVGQGHWQLLTNYIFGRQIKWRLSFQYY
jgi:hypothetical protein